MAFNYTATVETSRHGSGTSLNMRQTASTDGDLVCRIPNNATIYVESLSGTWLHAQYNGYTGYVMAIYVRESDEYGDASNNGIPTMGPSFTVFKSSLVNGSVNIRTAPNTGNNSTVIDSITGAEGTTAHTFTGVGSAAEQQQWLCLGQRGSVYAYVCARYVGVLGSYNAHTTATGGVNLRVGPSTNTDSIQTLPYGERVRVIDSSSVVGWYRVSCEYGTGWVAVDYISFN